MLVIAALSVTFNGYKSLERESYICRRNAEIRHQLLVPPCLKRLGAGAGKAVVCLRN